MASISSIISRIEEKLAKMKNIAIKPKEVKPEETESSEYKSKVQEGEQNRAYLGETESVNTSHSYTAPKDQ